VKVYQTLKISSSEEVEDAKMASYRDTLSARQKASYDTLNRQAEFLLADAQSRSASPQDSFGVQDIQALKSDIFTMSLGSPHSSQIRKDYGPAFDKLEASENSDVYRKIDVAQKEAAIRTSNAKIKREADKLREDREMEQRFSAMSQKLTPIFESNATPSEQANFAYRQLFTDPTLLQSDEGKKLLDITTSAIKNVTDPNVSNLGVKLFSDAITTQSPEAVEEAAKSIGMANTSPIVKGAKAAIKGSIKKDQRDKQDKLVEDRIKYLSSFVESTTGDGASWDSLKNASDMVLAEAASMGLATSEAYKNLFDWTQQPKPLDTAESALIGGAMFAEPKSLLQSLLYRVSTQPVTGVRKVNRFDPSSRGVGTSSTVGLGSLGIPSI